MQLKKFKSIELFGKSFRFDFNWVTIKDLKFSYQKKMIFETT